MKQESQNTVFVIALMRYRSNTGMESDVNLPILDSVQSSHSTSVVGLDRKLGSATKSPERVFPFPPIQCQAWLETNMDERDPDALEALHCSIEESPNLVFNSK